MPPVVSLGAAASVGRLRHAARDERFLTPWTPGEYNSASAPHHHVRNAQPPILGTRQMASDASTPPSELPPSIGRFQVKRLLGQGGMGQVFLAHDPKKDRQVALKVLSRENAQNETLTKRFRSEALATRELKHSNIVGVYEAGTIAGQFYIALEYVDGTDVGKLIQSRGRLPVRRSLDITLQVARGLAIAHSRNIVHRDIKPSNLLIRHDGAVKLTDMGLARSLGETSEAGITRAGTTVGTVDYISPEQARDSKAADTRSDIYSLGCTWYHMLTGQPPFPGGSLTSKLKQHATSAVPDPRQLNDQVPESVTMVLFRMLAKEPEQRFKTPNHLIETLEAIDLDRKELSAEILAALAEDSVDEPGTRSTGAPDAPAATHSDNTRRETGTELASTPEAIDLATDTSTRRTPPVPVADQAVDRAGRRRRRGDTQAAPPAIESPDSRDTPPVRLPPPSPTRPRRTSRRLHQSTSQPDEQGVDWSRFRSTGIIVAAVLLVSAAGFFFVHLGQTVDLSSSHGSPFGKTNTPDARQTGSRPGTGEPGGGQETGANPDTPDIVYGELAPTSLAITAATPPDVPLGLRQGESRHLAKWATSGDTTGLSVLHVGHNAPGQDHLPSLQAAISAVGPDGAWIRLHGPGPFFLTTPRLENKKRIVISSSSEKRSVVVLEPGATPVDTAWHVTATHLRLDRIDLVLLPDGFPGERKLTVIRGHDSDLSLHHCSITQPRHREAGTVAVAAEGRVDKRPARILLHNVLVRGRNTTGVELASDSIDTAIINSLLLTDSASPVALLPSSSDGQLPAQRHLRIVSSTLCSDAPLLNLAPAAQSSTRPTTSIRTINSLLACPSSGDGVLVDLGPWPQEATANGNRFKGLTWETHGSVAFGVREFIRRSPDAGPSISSFSEWESCWKSPGEASMFVAAPWRPLNASADRVKPLYFDTGNFARQLPPATDGNAPGCRVRSLGMPAPAILATAPIHVSRPRWTRVQETTRPFLRLDLKDHPDLGRFLANHPPPPGAVIEVTGRGRHSTSPIEVRDGGLTLVFQDAAKDTPLVIVPNRSHPAPQDAPNTPAPASDSGNDPATPPAVGQSPPPAPTGTNALITVTSGRLEMISARIQWDGDGHPGWLLKVDGGSFALRRCSLLGPRGTPKREQGVIDWRSDGDSATGEIHSSFIAGSGELVRLGHGNQSLLVSNSVLVSTGDLVRCSPAPPQASVMVDLRHSTLSATRRIIALDSPRGSSTATGMLSLFSHATHFAGPLPVTLKDASEATLLSCTSQMISNKSVTWSGTHNGFSSRLKHLHTDPTTTTRPDAAGVAERFSELFPGPRRIRPLHGPAAVPLATLPPEATRIRPMHLRLKSGSRGATWAPGGTAIGANTAPLESQLGNVGPPPNAQTDGTPDF
mgnify:CR=1 FL=1